MKSACWDLGLSEEIVQGLKFKFHDIDPEIQGQGLMGVSLIGMYTQKFVSQEVVR